MKAYFAALPTESRDALENLRRTIKSAAPEATEGLSYGMPAFKAHGRGLVCYAAFKDHYSLFPMGGSVFDVLGEKLEPYRSGKGTIRFEMDKPLPVSLVKRVIKERLKENEARGRR